MPLLPNLDLFLSVEIAEAVRETDNEAGSEDEFKGGYSQGWLHALQMVKEWCVKEGLVA